MPRSHAPAMVAGMMAACLTAACGACASAPGAQGDTANPKTSASPPSPDARLETASLRRKGPREGDSASPWAGCYDYKDRVSCPGGNFDAIRFKETIKTVEAARTWYGDSDYQPVAIDGVPEGHAFVQDLPINRGFAASAVTLWNVVGTTAEADRVPLFRCWSRKSHAASNDFCRLAAAHFIAGTLPTDIPERNTEQVEIFGKSRPVFEKGYSPGHGVVMWKNGELHAAPYDDERAALDARATSLAFAKSHTSVELYDFRCSVTEVEGDCVLAQATIGSTGRVVRTVSGALETPAGWHLFACELRTYLDIVEEDYEVTCGTMVKILPTE